MNALKYLPKVIFMLAILASGCSGYMGLSRSQVNRIIELARRRALVDATDLDDASLMMIQTNRPFISGAPPSPTRAWWSVSWSVSSNRLLRVHGQGNLMELEGAKVDVEFRPLYGGLARSQEEIKHAIELARRRALAEAGGLDEGSRMSIQRNWPRVAYYPPSGWADYFISWPISSNRVIVVYGYGNMGELQGAKVDVHERRKFYGY
jgi:hypothetical protein